ncbi:uncharacterized protein LAESUDRAFT_645599 [Laetiporus sulphureus 93-53]|uniref:Uncharacterized protein n=1 Tax=Laetiporus sulphureus 93-53 TaxID=1314785 RepID=A0A165GDC3_9APHY|nr:uncharacterized protein LAESUDRAFT_645599 [Laetiporus sulphureus 93-53]KZT10191.1 hypothetical protein LAESUDRAFT_645599 [Laetiporus sulphureus 93-53]
MDAASTVRTDTGSSLNVFTPIALVPDDILLDIFHVVVASMWEDHKVTPWSSLDKSAPTLLSQVCRYWRHLILTAPRLWGYLILGTQSSSSALMTYLCRSRDAPIYVSFAGLRLVRDATEKLTTQALLLVGHVHRFVKFHALHLQPKEMTAILSPLMIPAPRLSSLMLHAERQLLSPSIFSRQLPSLREVSVKGVSMAWLPYKNMTAIILKDQLTPSLDKLLWTLRNCPMLERLDLGFLGAINHEDASNNMPTERVVNLLYLQDLALRSYVHNDIVDILAHLSFQPSTAIDLTFYGSRRTPINLAKDCPSLRAIVSRMRSLQLRMIAAYTWSSSLSLESEDGKLRLRWEWYEEDSLGSILPFIGFSTISFPALRHLAIYATSYRLKAEQWATLILAPVSTIESLDIDFQNSRVMEFFKALRPRTGAPITVCPNLVHIVASHVDEQHRVLQELAASVGSRALQGSRLREFEITLHSGKNLPNDVYVTLLQWIGKITIKLAQKVHGHLSDDSNA